MWWRGHRVANWPLKPGAFRQDANGSHYDGTALLGHFMMRAPGRLGHRKQPSSEMEWLFLAQHYGLPTILLDWTESPLIALYFALSENVDSGDDACLWALSPSKLNAEHADPRSPGASQRGLRNSDERLVRAIAMQAAGFKDRAIGKRLFPDEPELPPLPKVIALATPDMDERIVAQIGRFTIHQFDGALNEFQGSHQYLRKFTIPAYTKRKLSSLLQAIGITRWSLFPDLQSLADGLRQREYF